MLSYDDTNDETDDDADDSSGDSQDDSDDSGQNGSDDNDSDDDNAQAAANMSDAEVDAHRGALSGILDKLQSQGVDVNALASQVGLDSADVNDLEDGDVLALAKQVASQHPELTQSVLGRFPLAQGFLGRFLG